MGVGLPLNASHPTLPTRRQKLGSAVFAEKGVVEMGSDEGGKEERCTEGVKANGGGRRMGRGRQTGRKPGKAGVVLLVERVHSCPQVHCFPLGSSGFPYFMCLPEHPPTP